jgi:hypothetical protein
MKSIMRKKFIPVAVLFLMAGPCYGQQKKPVSLRTYIDRFALVPNDEKTQYMVELLVAIPDTNHPKRLFSFRRGKMGHVFIGLSKSNGPKQVVEYLGFYARSPLPALLLAIGTGASGVSAIRDNQGHAFNAKLDMKVNAKQFDSVLTCLLRNSTKKYSLFRYNCVNYSLDAFNSVRVQPLHPEGLVLTPNSLYLLLRRSGEAMQFGQASISGKYVP